MGEAEPRSAPPVPQPLILHVAKDVHAVAVSPGGTRLAIASGRGHMVGPRVRIWNLQMGAEVRKLRLFVDAVAFSPDGTRLATGCGNTAQIWDAATGQRQLQVTHGRTARVARMLPFVAVLSPVFSSIWAVAFSPDGTRLATGCGNTARIWDAATGQQRLQVTHGEPVLARDAATGQQRLQITPAARCGRWRSARTAPGWPPAAATPRGSGTPPPGGSCSRSRPGAHGASGGVQPGRHPAGHRRRDNTAGSGTSPPGGSCSNSSTASAVRAVAFSPDGTRLATGGCDTARVWDAATGKQRLQVTHGDTVLAVAFSPDGTRLATGGGNTARIWDISGR